MPNSNVAIGFVFVQQALEDRARLGEALLLDIELRQRAARRPRLGYAARKPFR